MINKLIESKPYEANIFNCLEELSELIQAVSKYERYRMLGKINELPKLRKNIIEELADSDLSMDILRNMFDVDVDEYNVKYREKLKRSLDRIE